MNNVDVVANVNSKAGLQVRLEVFSRISGRPGQRVEASAANSAGFLEPRNMTVKLLRPRQHMYTGRARARARDCADFSECVTALPLAVTKQNGYKEEASCVRITRKLSVLLSKFRNSKNMSSKRGYKLTVSRSSQLRFQCAQPHSMDEVEL